MPSLVPETEHNIIHSLAGSGGKNNVLYHCTIGVVTYYLVSISTYQALHDDDHHLLHSI